MWAIIWFSFLSGMSTPLGGWLVLRFHRLSEKILALFLGMATGIMITVVLTELMPTSIQSGGHLLFLIGLIGGWVFMLLLRHVLTHRIGQGLMGEKAALLQMGWFIAFAIVLHDLPEGLAIGAGDAVHPQLGVVIALAIALHNIPEGMSIAVPLRMAGVSRAKVLWVTFLTGFITPLGTILSLWLVAVSSLFISLSLAFASGTMAYVVSRDLLPEALHAHRLYAGIGAGCGAMLMMLVSMLH